MPGIFFYSGQEREPQCQSDKNRLKSMQKRSRSDITGMSGMSGIDPFSILADNNTNSNKSSELFGNTGLDWRGQGSAHNGQSAHIAHINSANHKKFVQQFPSVDIFMTHLLEPIAREQQLRWQQVEQHDPVTQAANPEWLRSRLVKGFAKRLSGSSVGGIFGVNKYSSPTKSLSEFLWPSFRGNAACAYGNHHEPIVENMFMNWHLNRVIDSELNQDGTYRLKRTQILNFGLCARRELPLFGYSPDGVLEEEWESVEDPSITKTVRTLLEYKCPYSRRNTTIADIEMRLGDLYPQNRIPHSGYDGLTLPVPPSYYAQMMWGHRVLYDDVLHYDRPDDCPPAYFVVWCPAVHPLIQQRQEQKKDNYVEDGLSPLEFVEFRNSSQNSTFACSVEGTMQITRVRHDPVFCRKMEQVCERWWKEEYVPVLYDKLSGKIKHGEISCASTAIDILL
jgi:hypothetical protein